MWTISNPRRIGTHTILVDYVQDDQTITMSWGRNTGETIQNALTRVVAAAKAERTRLNTPPEVVTQLTLSDFD